MIPAAFVLTYIAQIAGTGTQGARTQTGHDFSWRFQRMKVLWGCFPSSVICVKTCMGQNIIISQSTLQTFND